MLHCGTRSLLGPARSDALKESSIALLLVVVEEAEDVVFLEAISAFEEVEFYGEGEAGDFTAELLDELYGGLHGAAGGEEVVDEDDALAGLDGVHVDLQGVGAVLEVVGDAGDGGGELARLAHGDEAGVEAVGEGGSEDEAAGLNAEDEVDVFFDVIRGERIDEFGEAGLIFEKRGDVIEEDAGLGEVGYGADEGLQLFYVDRLGFGHKVIIKAAVSDWLPVASRW
jgi:hypothetical protein